MNVAAGRVKPGRNRLPQISGPGLAEKRMEEAQELERPHEESATTRRLAEVADRDEQPAIRFIDFDDLARPYTIPTVSARTITRQADKVVGGVDVALEPGWVRTTGGDGTFPGPVKLDGVADLKDENGFAGFFGQRLDIPAAETLPADRAAVLSPDRFGGSGNELQRPSWQVEVTCEPDKFRAARRTTRCHREPPQTAPGNTVLISLKAGMMCSSSD